VDVVEHRGSVPEVVGSSLEHPLTSVVTLVNEVELFTVPDTVELPPGSVDAVSFDPSAHELVVD
jgi:hypothetical protein